jgi:hypothetical protein
MEILSQFGRANYDYDDKYLVTATVEMELQILQPIINMLFFRVL